MFREVTEVAMIKGRFSYEVISPSGEAEVIGFAVM